MKAADVNHPLFFFLQRVKAREKVLQTNFPAKHANTRAYSALLACGIEKNFIFVEILILYQNYYDQFKKTSNHRAFDAFTCR